MQLKFEQDYSDFDVLPLYRLATALSSGAEGVSMTELDACMAQSWKSLQCIFGDSLPADWFNEKQKRIKLHSSEILILSAAINADLSASKSYLQASGNARLVLETEVTQESVAATNNSVVADPVRQEKIAALQSELAFLQG